jgi:Tfp pilus assembly protein PilX
MMFVLLVMLLIAAVTLSVMNLIAADQAAGIHELQAVQVFNVADAGIQYAIGQLQASGANTYAGQTLTVTGGATTLGTANITVNCIDTGTAPPCSGTWAGYRRIVSVGTLTIVGPSRTIVAVVQGYGLARSPYALCASSALTVLDSATIYGDVGSNGTITLQSSVSVNGDPNAPPQYVGLARANGTITCADGCGTQVAGGATPNAVGWVCPTVTTGPFAPGALNRVVGNFTMNGVTGYNWNNFTVTAGTCGGGSPYRTLGIQAGAAGTTTVVQFNSLTMNNCTRLMILGAGNVDLRIGQATGTGLSVGQASHFGVLPADTQASPAPVPASQLQVQVNSSSSCTTSCAVNIQSDGVTSGVFLVPNGEIYIGQNVQGSGAVLANLVTFDQNLTFTYDTSAGIAAPVFFTFDNLRSWKDQ